MPRWDVGPTVYIGDAAHAMSPQLGQGANIALNDAFILGTCLREEPDVLSALASYFAPPPLDPRVLPFRHPLGLPKLGKRLLAAWPVA